MRKVYQANFIKTLHYLDQSYKAFKFFFLSEEPAWNQHNLVLMKYSYKLEILYIVVWMAVDQRT